MNTCQQGTNTKFLSFRAIKLPKKSERREHQQGKKKKKKKDKQHYVVIVHDQFRKSCKVIATTSPLNSYTASEDNHRSTLGRDKFGLFWVKQGMVFH